MSVATQVFGRFGLPDRPCSHGRCPNCEQATLWIPRSGTIAHCYHADCNKTWTAKEGHETLPNSHIILGMEKFAEDCIDWARSAGVGNPQHDHTWLYLTKKRHIHPSVLWEVRIGIVPANYDPEDVIGLALDSARRDDMNRFEEVQRNPSQHDGNEFFTAEKKVMASFVIPLREHVASKAGWLVFFYEGASGHAIAANFRNPDLDEQGHKVVRMFNPLDRRGVFAPMLQNGSERVLIAEGEFNLLRYMSEAAQGNCIGWLDSINDNITVGSSSGVDTETLKSLLDQYERVPVVVEDNDQAGGNVTQSIRKATGSATFRFRLPSDKKGYDLDSYFGDGGTLEFIDEMISRAERCVLPWSEIASELDTIRCRTRVVLGEDGKQKQKTLPPHIGDMKVYQYVVKSVEAQGELYFSTFPYIYLPSEHRLIQFREDATDTTDLLLKLKLLITQRDYALVLKNIEHHIIANGESVEVDKLGCYRNGAIYVNKGDGQLLRITENDITVEHNGIDGVLMYEPSLLPWPDPNEHKDEVEKLKELVGGQAMLLRADTPLRQYLRANWDKQGLTPDEFEQLFFTRYLSLWIANSLKLWPIMAATGEPNNGKSTAFEKLMWLLYDPSYESENLPDNRRSLLAKVTNGGIALFDNVDGANMSELGYIDIFCKCATGGTEPIAVLYKTNVLKNFNLRCNLFFTARAWNEDRGDLARRTLFFPVRTMSREERTDVGIISARIQDLDYRRTLQLETLVRLQLVLRAMNALEQKQYVGESGMLDYEFWTRRVAEFEGWEENMRRIWEIQYNQGQTQAASVNTMVQTVRLWLGKIGGDDSMPNVSRIVQPSEMFKEIYDLNEKTNQKHTYTSVVSFGRAMERNITELHTLGIEQRGAPGHRKYVFRPTEDAAAQCREIYLNLTKQQ